MKKFLIFAVAVQMLSACFMGNEAKEEAMQKERDSLQRIINEKDLELNDIMGTINVVQEGISRINEAEG
ncbi:MAG: lipoprotein, partial [Bacteroidaceae bacterium]|nr:lipoprotein [Bacteroidaceae bacterium]